MCGGRALQRGVVLKVMLTKANKGIQQHVLRNFEAIAGIRNGVDYASCYTGVRLQASEMVS